jgi:hypothetical protein
MRLVYRRRRAELARVTTTPLEGVSAGLHAHGYWRQPGADGAAALILGYATPPSHAWSRALGALAEVVQGNGR